MVPRDRAVWGGPYDGFTEPAQPGDQNAKRVVDKHVRVFKEQVELAQKHAPAYINSHSAKDFFTVNMATDFFSEALEYAPVCVRSLAFGPLS